MSTEISEDIVETTKVFEVDETIFSSPIELKEPLIEFSDSPAPKLRVELGYHDRSRFAKVKTENVQPHKWAFARSIANPYELLDTGKKYFDDNTKYYRSSFIDKFDKQHKPPISRAYHKIFECISRFRAIPSTHTHFVSLHIAEGPGGFIEATVDYRKRLYSKYQKKDKYYGITLRESQAEKVPAFGEEAMGMEFLKENSNVIITYGGDKGTGDITDPKTIIALQKQTKGKCQFITADGGFNYEGVENIQEQLVDQLLFGECVGALACAGKDSSFICKLYDVFTEPTEKILELVASYYEEFWFYKPETSRGANSERYFVAKGFKGITDKQLSYLLSIMKIWRDTVVTKKFDPRYPSKFPIQILNREPMDEQFRQFTKYANQTLLTQQVNKITEIVGIAEHRISTYMKDHKTYTDIIDKQKKFAEIWVNRYYDPLLQKKKNHSIVQESHQE